MKIGDLRGRPRAIRAAFVSGMTIAAAGVATRAQTAARVRTAKEEKNLIVYGCWVKESRALKRRIWGGRRTRGWRGGEGGRKAR